MHYLPFGDRLNKGILMVTQLNTGFPRFLISKNFEYSCRLTSDPSLSPAIHKGVSPSLPHCFPASR